VTVTRIAESGQACGGAGVVGVGRVVVVVLGAALDELGDGEFVELPRTRTRPVAGGLEDGAALVASGTPSEAPRTDGTVSLPPSSAPIAQTKSTAPTAVPAMAMMRRRRYTDGGSGPLGSSTCGN
jgi:hypothetical protein